MEQLSLDDIAFIGHSLSRPECALAHESGMIFAPDWTGDGGVSAIFPDGSVKRHLAANWPEVAASLNLDEPLRPNGICLLEGGDFLLAHLGAERGGIFHLRTDGSVEPFLTEIDGEPLPPSNFVIADDRGRIWVTVSTRRTPRAAAYRSDIADGFIVLVDGKNARIVADGLGYTNECAVHPDGKRLFVNETFARRLTRFEIAEDGSLSNRRMVASFGHGTFPDGLAFDVNGDAWITSIVSNRVLKVKDTGEIEVFVQDVDPNHLEWAEEAWQTHAMGRPHLDKAAGRKLRNVSNLAFYGAGLDRAVLGCLLGEKLATAQMPINGDRPVHWAADIAALITALEKEPKL